MSLCYAASIISSAASILKSLLREFQIRRLIGTFTSGTLIDYGLNYVIDDQEANSEDPDQALKLPSP